MCWATHNSLLIMCWVRSNIQIQGGYPLFCWGGGGGDFLTQWTGDGGIYFENLRFKEKGGDI